MQLERVKVAVVVQQRVVSLDAESCHQRVDGAAHGAAAAAAIKSPSMSIWVRSCLWSSVNGHILHYIRNRPNFVGRIGAFSAAANDSPSTRRVCAGSITPSSHSRALA